MLKAKQICEIEEIHPVDEWYALRHALIGKEISILHSHESLFDKGFLFVIGELEQNIFGGKQKTFLAVKLRETEKEEVC